MIPIADAAKRASGLEAWPRAQSTLESGVTAENVHGLVEDLRNACDAGVVEACTHLATRVSPPRRLDGAFPLISQEMNDAGGSALVVVVCKVSRSGTPSECEPKLKAPYRLTELVMQSSRGWRFEPARFDGIPVGVDFAVNVRYVVPRSTPSDTLREAERRLSAHPDDPSAQRHLALVLDEVGEQHRACKLARTAAMAFGAPTWGLADLLSRCALREGDYEAALAAAMQDRETRKGARTIAFTAAKLGRCELARQAVCVFDELGGSALDEQRTEVETLCPR